MKRQALKAGDFLISVRSIKGDTIINSAVYYAGHILCLQDDNKIFVLDTAFNFVDSLTKKFSSQKFELLHSYNDTILLSTGKDIFYLDTGFVLKKYDYQPFKYRVPYYTDSTYYVYACDAGEWGGSVFFWNRKTNKTYSYPATGVQQILKFKGKYVISSFLAHLSGFSDYLSVKDPAKLYELKDEKQKTFCNWWSVDSIVNSKLFDTVTPPGVKYYADKSTTRTLIVFPYNDTLYSIYSTDSGTILAKHVDFKLVTVDTLLKRGILFNDASTYLADNIAVTSYKASLATIEANDKIINYQNTGLIFVHDKRITFIEFVTPHMWKENNNR